jgi:hypothetical protein
MTPFCIAVYASYLFYAGGLDDAILRIAFYESYLSLPLSVHLFCLVRIALQDPANRSLSRLKLKTKK